MGPRTRLAAISETGEATSGKIAGATLKGTGARPKRPAPLKLAENRLPSKATTGIPLYHAAGPRKLAEV